MRYPAIRRRLAAKGSEIPYEKHRIGRTIKSGTSSASRDAWHRVREAAELLAYRGIDARGERHVVVCDVLHPGVQVAAPMKVTHLNSVSPASHPPNVTNDHVLTISLALE